METQRQAAVLIVDDVAVNRITLCSLLKPLNLNITEASSGKQALTAILECHFSMIILDISMPEMDGYETAKHIRNTPNYQTVPIIMVTGVYLDHDSYLKAYQSGATDFIKKPVESTVLHNKIHFYLGLESQRQQHELNSKRFEAILNSVDDGVLEVDLAGEIIFYNEAAAAMLEQQKDELLGSLFSSYIDMPNSKPITVAELIKNKSCHQWQTCKQHQINISYDCSAIKGKQGKIVSYVIVFRKMLTKN